MYADDEFRTTKSGNSISMSDEGRTQMQACRSAKPITWLEFRFHSAIRRCCANRNFRDRWGHWTQIGNEVCSGLPILIVR